MIQYRYIDIDFSRPEFNFTARLADATKSSYRIGYNSSVIGIAGAVLYNLETSRVSIPFYIGDSQLLTALSTYGLVAAMLKAPSLSLTNKTQIDPGANDEMLSDARQKLLTSIGSRAGISSFLL